MDFKTTKYLIFLILIVYATIGFASGDTFDEPYPFFSWSLFGRVPTERQKFTIRVLEYGQTRFEEPVYFKDAEGFFSNIDQSPSGYEQMIQRIGGYHVNLENDLRDQEREKLEVSFNRYPVLYELIKFRFSPIPYYKNGEIIEEEVVATFSTKNND